MRNLLEPLGRVLASAAVIGLLAVTPACSDEPDLVVYVALDQEYSEPLIQAFEKQTGLTVDAQYDTEASKTVGLVTSLITEKNRPRADVFWNNEIAQTLRLKNLGVTESYASPRRSGLPDWVVDPEGHWTGFAARARVIMFVQDQFADGQGPPTRVTEMSSPGYAKTGAMARPLTGTTLTHFSALCAIDGEAAVHAWLNGAKASGLTFGRGNAHVMRRVCEKDFAWCLTDTDDAAAARRNGYPVEILFPDQGEGEPGALLIPNSACIIRGARHRENAEKFIDYLLSPEVEVALAHSGSDQIPLRPGVAVPDHIRIPGRDFRVMEVDWEAVAVQVDQQTSKFTEMFTE